MVLMKKFNQPDELSGKVLPSTYGMGAPTFYPLRPERAKVVAPSTSWTDRGIQHEDQDCWYLSGQKRVLEPQHRPARQGGIEDATQASQNISVIL